MGSLYELLETGAGSLSNAALPFVQALISLSGGTPTPGK
ncbi:hypothetical protein DFR69_101102 [Nocardia neocaledoniensis]|uniref:Uncharacterized protein n=1 Tax=Nocardia neocaledoniensis TaxID=236511 RepID=A0A317NZ91_9NOCA|nr:hypothetical protein DFR69_101102 [Nocardia neocaledoniensis]